MHPAFNYLSVSRRELINPKLLYGSIFRKYRDINVFFHHDVLLRIPDKILADSSDNRVYLTHLNSDFANNQQLIKKIRLCSRVIVQNSTVKASLVLAGIDVNKILVALGAVDRIVYFPLEDLESVSKPYVIVVGDCKPRKRPELLRRVIESAPEINFLIHGKNWREQLGFGDSLPLNTQIKDFKLEDNPDLMRRASAILNVAEIEGGPYPILEALASGTPVATSDCGFASEVVTRKSGEVFPLEASVLDIKSSLLRAMALKKSSGRLDLLEGKLSWADHGLALYG